MNMTTSNVSTPLGDISNSGNIILEKRALGKNATSSSVVKKKAFLEKELEQQDDTEAVVTETTQLLNNANSQIIQEKTDLNTDFPVYNEFDEEETMSPLSAAHEMLIEMEKRQEAIYKLENELLEAQECIEHCKNENQQLKYIHETHLKNFEIEKISIANEKDKQLEMEKNVLNTMHVNQLKAKDEEIARLHEVLEQKDRKIQQGTDMRQMLQKRHTEMISQISNAHDAQLEQQSNANQESMKEAAILYEKKMQEEIQKCENKAALNLSKELAKSMATSMEQMMLLDCEWKEKEKALLKEMKELKKFANEELEGEVLSIEALHASTLEMERANSVKLINQAKIDSIEKYKLNLRNRLDNAKYPNGCSSCTITFGTFDRKSHCRSCGLLICSNCAFEKKCVLCRRDEYRN